MTTQSMDKVLYTARTHTVGGRDGRSSSSDGRLDIKLSPPGTSGAGTNPEQLFAAGWSACFQGAMARAAKAMQITLPPDVYIDAEIDLGMNGDAFLLRARLHVKIPGLDQSSAQTIIEQAHQLCPYSRATRGNIEVALTVID